MLPVSFSLLRKSHNFNHDWKDYGGCGGAVTIQDSSRFRCTSLSQGLQVQQFIKSIKRDNCGLNSTKIHILLLGL